MSDKKSLIDKAIEKVNELSKEVELLFSENTPEIVEEVEPLAKVNHSFADFKLATGETIVTDTEEIGTGTAVTIVAEDGTEAPITDGSYSIVVDETHTIDITTVGGLVESFEAKEVETPAEEVAPTEEVPEEMEVVPEVAPVDAKLAEIEARLAKVEEACGVMAEMSAKQLAEVEAKYNDVNSKYTDVTTKYTEIENNYNSVKSLNEKLASEKEQLKSLFNQMFELMKEIGNAGSVQPTAQAHDRQFSSQKTVVSKIDQMLIDSKEWLEKQKNK